MQCVCACARACDIFSFIYLNLTMWHICFLVAWWDNFGNGTLDLQSLAVRVLSQCCSATGRERNWDIFKYLHSRNLISRLERSRLHDIVFVRYNLKLRERYKNSNNFMCICTVSIYLQFTIVMQEPA